jgi:tRNA pseudouridine13 synthase
MSEAHLINEYSTDFPYALGTPALSAGFRVEPEDFVVEERLPFEPSGEGEHVLLWIQKRNLNTEDVVKRILRLTGLRPVNIGYAGQKDRRAVTRQWFSVHLPKGDADWRSLEEVGVLQVLNITRHHRKLQRGALSGNAFCIRLRNLEGDEAELERRITAVKEIGVPNYFGEQRFGREGRNLGSAQALFSGKRIKSKHQRSMYLSAARSYLFNQVLAARIAAGNWNQPLPGEALQLAGSKSYFVAESIDAEILQRFQDGDVLPTGPLWGRGELPTKNEVETLERAAVAPYGDFCQGLERAGLKQERRALRLSVTNFQWQLEADDLMLDFYLPAGTYATSVLREVISTKVPQ